MFNALITVDSRSYQYTMNTVPYGRYNCQFIELNWYANIFLFTVSVNDLLQSNLATLHCDILYTRQIVVSSLIKQIRKINIKNDVNKINLLLVYYVKNMAVKKMSC